MKRILRLALVLFLVNFIFPAVATARICSPGDKAQVKWRGTWYPATVINAQGNKCYIHYDGYGNSWDEWVGPGRIQITSSMAGGIQPGSVVVGNTGYQVGSPVQVLWGGKWWPARVKQVRGDQLYIHYNGYGNKWDEWVGPDRYR
jgi:RNA binding activity-knot of a chromodomain.